MVTETATQTRLVEGRNYVFGDQRETYKYNGVKETIPGRREHQFIRMSEYSSEGELKPRVEILRIPEEDLAFRGNLVIDASGTLRLSYSYPNGIDPNDLDGEFGKLSKKLAEAGK